MLNSIMFSIENVLIAYGSAETASIDEENCLFLGCISYYHCTMEVDYSWYLNGSLLKKGRKTNLVYVQQPGQYQCVLTVNDHVAKSEIINIVIVEEKCIEEAAADDKLHHPTQSNPPEHQEKDGIVMLLLTMMKAV